MAVPAWGIAFIVLSIILCCVGGCLFYYGFVAGREALREQKDIENQQRAHRGFQGRPANRANPAQQLYNDATYTTPPARERSNSRTPAATTRSQSAHQNETPVRTDESQMREFANMAEVAEEEARLERDIQRLENEQYALENRWEGTVTVMVITGGQHSIDFVSTDKLSELKDKLYELTNIIPQRIRLTHAGTMLTPDTYMLGAFKVPANPTLHMMIKSDGEGMPEPPKAPKTTGDAKPMVGGGGNDEMARAALAVRKAQGEDVAEEEARLAGEPAQPKDSTPAKPEESTADVPATNTASKATIQGSSKKASKVKSTNSKLSAA